MATDQTTIRPATVSDLELVVSLTRTMRRQLAEWAPVYFRPAEGSDEAHAGFLGFIIASEDHPTKILEAAGEPVGFFVTVAQNAHTWVDDLCLTDGALWPETIAAINQSTGSAWVTCVSSQDSARAAAFAVNRVTMVSSYWARPTQLAPSPRPLDRPLPQVDLANAARHTFGGEPFRPEAPGALVVSTDDGYAIGSPSMTPPIYDPGGPTVIIDQVVGRDRPKVLHHATAAAADRGDAQVVVVCADEDHELKDAVTEAGFTRVVELIESSP